MNEFQKTVFHAAQNLFAQYGFEGTSISAIAARAGVAKSTVLHHFPSKLRLYQRVMKHSIECFSAILEGDAAGPAADAQALLVERFRMLLRWMIAEPVHAKLLNRIFLDNPGAAPVAAKKYWLPLMARLTAGFPDTEEVRLFVLFIINSVFQMAHSIELQVLLVGEKVSRDALAGRYEVVVEICIAEFLARQQAAVPYG